MWNYVFCIITAMTIQRTSSVTNRLSALFRSIDHPNSKTLDYHCCQISEENSCTPCRLLLRIINSFKTPRETSAFIFTTPNNVSHFDFDPPLTYTHSYTEDPDNSISLAVGSYYAPETPLQRHIDSFAEFQSYDIFSMYCSSCLGFARVASLSFDLRTFKQTITADYRTFIARFTRVDFRSSDGGIGNCCNGVVDGACDKPCFYEMNYFMDENQIFQRKRLRANHYQNEVLNVSLPTSLPSMFNCIDSKRLNIHLHTWDSTTRLDVFEIIFANLTPNHEYSVLNLSSSVGYGDLSAYFKFESLGYDGPCAESSCISKNGSRVICGNDGLQSCADKMKSNPPLCNEDTSICAVERPCLNGGSCKGNEINFECTCLAEYTGEFCELAACNDSCVNGVCTGKSACQCNRGWTGHMCREHSCEGADYCNGRECSVVQSIRRCKCDPRSELGRYCHRKCNPVCLNGKCATSGATNLCACDPGWTGYQCEHPIKTSGSRLLEKSSDFFIKCGYISGIFVIATVLVFVLLLVLVRNKKSVKRDRETEQALQMTSKILFVNEMKESPSLTIAKTRETKGRATLDDHGYQRNNPNSMVDLDKNNIYVSCSNERIIDRKENTVHTKERSKDGKPRNQRNNCEAVYSDCAHVYADHM